MTNTLPIDNKTTTQLSFSQLLPTRGQLQRTLSQKLQSFYHKHLGHRTGKITCNILEESISIVIENAITKPEQLLAHQEQQELLTQLRIALDKAIKPLLMALIQEIVGTKVVDLLSDTTLETRRTGIIVILSDTPKFRPAASIAKTTKK